MIVRRLRADEAPLFKTLRLRALADAPDAFAHTYDEISAKPDTYWAEMTRSVTEPDRYAMFVAEAVLAWARERGFADIALWVTKGNAAAEALYERMGFTRTGRSDRLPSNARLAVYEMGRAL